MMKKISRVLIANRGEIALRIKRACEKLGIIPIGIASDPDKGTFFARSFKEIIYIGGNSASESYLSIDKILEAAKKAKADAVHPGYGFLSENADFARAVIKAGLIFIGPSPESIDLLGDKTKARRAVEAAGVPTVPGSLGGLSNEKLKTRAEEIGLPVIIKAAAGGGGRGMRVVNSIEEMEESLQRARGEAKKFFSNEDVFIEKYIEDPRHIEVQLFGDTNGNIVHLGTRDCSLQRRHQKIIEEAPAPNLTPKLRESIHQAAVNAAKSANYFNAGTAEFLLSGDRFYFLEMNTRIQVEHCVTEEITGIDLVQLQLRVAQGESLPFKQPEIVFNGHAIECRVCAEDPQNNFTPSLGRLSISSDRVLYREERGFDSGDEISPYYDSMISKIIEKGETRLQAINKTSLTLQGYKITGVITNVDFLRYLLIQKPFREGRADIKYVEREFNPTALNDFLKNQEIDPRHKGREDSEFVEVISYVSKKSGKEYEIRVVHRHDMTFLAAPFANNKPPSLEQCRRSNHFQTAVDAVIELIDA